MPIKLSVEVDAPLSNDDRDLLAGIAVMILAIANRELAQQGFPSVFPPDEPETADQESEKEGATEPDPGRPN